MFAYCGNNPVMYVDSVGSVPTPFNYEWKNPLVDEDDEDDEDDSDADTNGTVSIGIGGTITPFFLSFGAEIFLSSDMNGRTYLQWAPIRGCSGGYPGFSVMPFIALTNAPTVENLEGEAHQFGVTAPTSPGIALDYLMFQDSKSGKMYSGVSLACGPSKSFGKSLWERHLLLTETETIAEMPFNLLAILDNIYNSLIYGAD